MRMRDTIQRGPWATAAPWVTVAPWAARCLFALCIGLRQIAQAAIFGGRGSIIYLSGRLDRARRSSPKKIPAAFRSLRRCLLGRVLKDRRVDLSSAWRPWQPDQLPRPKACRFWTATTAGTATDRLRIKCQRNGPDGMTAKQIRTDGADVPRRRGRSCRRPGLRATAAALRPGRGRASRAMEAATLLLIRVRVRYMVSRSRYCGGRRHSLRSRGAHEVPNFFIFFI